MSETESSKYSFLPIKYPKLIEYYKDQRDAFWTVNEIDFSKDRKDWDALNDGERKFLTFILAFFSQADGIVIENLLENFQRETSEYKEVGAFYNMQNAIETIHNETYSVMIETFITNIDERMKALNAIENYPEIKNLSLWMKKWMDKELPLLERIIAFICVEGIFFTGAFCAIYWIKKRNMLRGLCKANELIARDEAIHTQFGISLYHHYTRVFKKFKILEQSRVYEIIQEAMSVSEVFIREALNVELIGMNADEMIQYVKCNADWVVTSLGYDKLYNVNNPFDWMVLISMINKSNFFETEVSEYSLKRDNDYTFDTQSYF